MNTPQLDHTHYPRSLRLKPADSIRYIIKDCKEAMKANPDNPKNGYYADVIAYCGMELRRRGLA